MWRGDLISLKGPFTARVNDLKAYRFGRVVARVTVDADQMVLARLCVRTGAAVLSDDQEQPVLYEFWLHEVKDWSGRRFL